MAELALICGLITAGLRIMADFGLIVAKAFVLPSLASIGFIIYAQKNPPDLKPTGCNAM